MDVFGGVSYNGVITDIANADKYAPTKTDYVDTYFEKGVPYSEYGVIEVPRSSSPESGRVKSKVLQHEKTYNYTMPIYQTHRDTLANDIVKYADKAITEEKFRGEKVDADEYSHDNPDPNRGFYPEGIPVGYDPAEYQTIRVKLPDGRIAVKI